MAKVVNHPTSDIYLVHSFKDIIPDIDEFCQADNGVGVINTINAFCNRVKKLAEKYMIQIDPDSFKGCSLEILGEYLCKSMGADNRVGVFNYQPVLENDIGVDGYGVGGNQNPMTVQFKFRAGDYVLQANEDHLTNFIAASWRKYGVKMEDRKNMLIVTTGLKLCDYSREEMLYDSVRVLNRDDLREMLDNRPEWWIRFWEALKASRTKVEDNPNKIVLRQHQIDAVDAIMLDDNMRGKIIMPTGTGKTEVEAEVILRKIKDLQAKGILPIIKVNSPRILLCFQLTERIFKYLNDNGIVARYVNFNSGNMDDRTMLQEFRKSGGVYREIVSTTSPKELEVAYGKACRENLPFIVFSTYHSSCRFADSNLVPHLTVHDEAHNLVSNEFSAAAKLPTGGNLFFTATEKTTGMVNGKEKYSEPDAGLGMNNPEIFDNMIFNRSPKQMINLGEMVSPKIHVVTTDGHEKIDLDKLDKDYDALCLSIFSAFDEHQKTLNKTSYATEKLGAKVLVVARGQIDLMEMFGIDESGEKRFEKFEKFRMEHPKIHVFAMSSDFGLYNDGEYYPPPVSSIKKFLFLKKVQSLKADEQAIIFHVDMIGEGIDVPGITGVMPFRNCELCKFLQNTGRASRLHPEDRKRLYSGEISTSDMSKWIKPNSWIIIPTFLKNADGFVSRMRDIINILRTDYGFIPKQNVLIDNDNGFSDKEPIDKENDNVKDRPTADSGVKTFVHELEDLFAEFDIEEEMEKINKIIAANDPEVNDEIVKMFQQGLGLPVNN